MTEVVASCKCGVGVLDVTQAENMKLEASGEFRVEASDVIQGGILSGWCYMKAKL